MDLKILIQNSERQYRPLLEHFFSSIYSEKVLPSHGLSHHRRVWNFAKELMLALETDSIDIHFINSLILSAYLHDLGMSVNHGPKHGEYSYELARRFLAENYFSEQDFPGMLQAVYDHDNKNYLHDPIFNVQTLLSIADDLDAFGFTGIYRYTEIYYLRGIESSEMGTRIIENATRRFSNFEHLFRNKKQLVNKHRKRFEVLFQFFNSFNLELHNGVSDHGHLKVTWIITEMIKTNGDLKEVAAYRRYDNDPVVCGFFKNLYSELD